jgi:hypothetical protein
MVENHPVDWGVVLRVYWTILWRSTAILLAIALPFNSLLTWLLATGRIGTDSPFLWSKLFTAFVLVLTGLVTVRMALRKRYRGFGIQIVPDQA